MADDTPVVIQESRWKSGLTTLALGGVLYLVVGRRLLGPAPSNMWDYFLVVVFGFGAACGAIETIQPSTLVLDPTGFTVRQFWRTRHTPWGAATNFRVGFGRSTRYVAYDAPGASRVFRSRQLPINWAMSPPDLAELMNDCEARWSSGGPVPREPTVT